MIFISTAGIGKGSTSETVELLAQHGVKHIELSAGKAYEPDVEKKLLSLQDQFELQYRCHNYFPPPQDSFVLNLASLDVVQCQRSLELCKRALRLSQVLGATRYAVHAGFFVQVKPSELGKRIVQQVPFDKSAALRRFTEGYMILEELADELNVDLYVENNVFSAENARSFSGVVPFMFTHEADFNELQSMCKCRCLLDLAHLKVSCKTLALNFFDQAKSLSFTTDYFHLSENDGLRDSNAAFDERSEIYRLLEQLSFRDKTVTLEVSDSIESVLQTCQLIERLFHD
jgi:sugar phosphate isomerase/epimerase